MKKVNQHRRHRKKRKCERGVKTKSMNKDCRYTLGSNGLHPRINWVEALGGKL